MPPYTRSIQGEAKRRGFGTLLFFLLELLPSPLFFFPGRNSCSEKMCQELGLNFPFLFQCFSVSQQSVFQKSNIVASNPVMSFELEYETGGDEDLFKAPEPIMEVPQVELDTMTVVSMISDGEEIDMKSKKISEIDVIQTEHTLNETFTLPECDTEEGDLFKAPVSLVEEPLLDYDPLTAISMISCGEAAVHEQIVNGTDIDLFQSNHLESEVFYECKKDLMEKSEIDGSFFKDLDLNIPTTTAEEDCTAGWEGLIDRSLLQKSSSSGSLCSVKLAKGKTPTFLDFPIMDIDAALRIRRVFSEADMQTLSYANAYGQMCSDPIEDRRQRLSRYRIKKAKRNFNRKIKYACRKVLADNQPRVRGRFAKVEEASAFKSSSRNPCNYFAEGQIKRSPAEESAWTQSPLLSMDKSPSAFSQCQQPSLCGFLWRNDAIH